MQLGCEINILFAIELGSFKFVFIEIIRKTQSVVILLGEFKKNQYAVSVTELIKRFDSQIKQQYTVF